MKRILLIAFGAILLAGTASAQLRKIPSEVTEAFKAKYPTATNVSWKDKVTVFEADFKLGDDNYEARFNNKGEWQQSEKNITESDLPSSVTEGLGKSKYTDWEIKSVDKLMLKDETTQYRLLVKRGTLEKKYLFFDADGKLLRDTLTL
jgi:Putative beta-lactamase-inhibitor-like, PepSY-like